eukprot:TRINITY_DN5358_c0_g1_i3.p1 TRINITY_DN5358_c0_g1~~TRINITY_DN5358_c0_g1_i3.p1  ORF type:complete len:240 (-),score=78.57 TRINITY_DN5358_c0_g1_i3:189-908(-)
MEFHDVGKHCDVASCGQLDFLPFSCKYCKGTFCQDHWREGQHKCIEKSLPSQDSSSEGTNISKSESKSFKCGRKGCKTREFVQVRCSKCFINFCLAHRFPQDHQCDPPKPKQKVQSSLLAKEKNPSASSISSLSSTSTSNKAQTNTNQNVHKKEVKREEKKEEVVEKRIPANENETTFISFKLPDGSSSRKSFKSSDTLSQIKEYAMKNLGVNEDCDWMATLPTRFFSDLDQEKNTQGA